MRPVEPKHEKDPLKAFIESNREAFDCEEPRQEIWEAIARNLPQEAVTRPLQPAPNASQSKGIIRQLYPYWRKAAVACMLLTIGLLGGMLLADDRGPAVASNQQTPEMQALELERYYQREIDRRLSMVASYRPDPELRRELSDMTVSDFREMQPMEEIPAGNERVVLQAIAQEYQAKLDALERVLERLRDAEQEQPRLNQPGPRSREEL